MPERIIIPITTCKYAKKKGIVKIESNSERRTKSTDKRFYNNSIGKDKPTFQDFVIVIDNEKDAVKLEKFIGYIKDLNIGGCLNCGYNNLMFSRDVKSRGSDEIVITCSKCLSSKSDGTSLSKEYIIWWNSILSGYGTFEDDGFPKAVHAQWGTKCHECGGSHDGGGYYFDFTTA